MSQKQHQPYVPASSNMAELTVKAVLLGCAMAVVLGAANAYLGMRAGLTVAATFPAAVVAMAVLRIFRRHDPGGEHRPDHRFRGRGAHRRRHFHPAGLRDHRRLGRYRILPQHRDHDDRRRARRAVRHHSAPHTGGRIGSGLPRVDRRGRDRQGGPGRADRRLLPVRRHGAGRLLGAAEEFRGLQVIQDNYTGFINFGKSKITILQSEIEYQGGMLWQTPPLRRSCSASASSSVRGFPPSCSAAR